MAAHAKTLNPRQQQFVLAVIAGLPYVDAARQAGYKATSRNLTSYASKIAKVPIVAKAIQDGRARALAITEMTADRWRTELTARYQQAAEGSRVGDQANALRALELWGRHLGILEPRTDDQAERTRILTEHLAMAMGLQMAARQLPETATVTVEGEVRDALQLPALAPASEEPRAREGEAGGPGDG